jgi:hypothetical protein
MTSGRGAMLKLGGACAESWVVTNRVSCESVRSKRQLIATATLLSLPGMCWLCIVKLFRMHVRASVQATSAVVGLSVSSLLQRCIHAAALVLSVSSRIGQSLPHRFPHGGGSIIWLLRLPRTRPCYFVCELEWELHPPSLSRADGVAPPHSCGAYVGYHDARGLTA